MHEGFLSHKRIIGFFVVWATTRQTRRVAHEQAEELITVARREAAVAAEEVKQKAAQESTYCM